MESGKGVSPRRVHPDEVGHTRSEFLATVSARQDLEDGRAAAQRTRAYNAWLVGQSDATTADTSDVEEAEAERQAHHEQWGPLVAERRRARRDAQKIAEAVARRGRQDLRDG